MIEHVDASSPRATPRLTEKDGTVALAERFDLTDDFKNGFIESLQVESVNNTHFSLAARRAGRRDDDLRNGHLHRLRRLSRRPVEAAHCGTVRAKRIIHDNVEKMIYYEDASFEFLASRSPMCRSGRRPIRSVKRKSGFLSPVFVYRSQLGAGVGVPYLLGACAGLRPDHHANLFFPAGPVRYGRIPSAL